MSSWLETYKPAVSSRIQLLLAAGMWSIVGAILLTFGTIWTLAIGEKNISMLILLIAVCLGLVKSFLILDRTAKRIAARIQQRGDGRCMGGFFSLRAWALIACMMLLGRLLRGTSVPRHLLGLVYAAVGTGLLISSRSIWLAWKNHRQANGGN